MGRQANGFSRMIVCPRSGPVEIIVIGTPTKDCNRSR
jgi:hypothetical protein